LMNDRTASDDLSFQHSEQPNVAILRKD